MSSTNGHGPKRAVLYARVSTSEQAEKGYSLAQQLEALREYAAREGYAMLEEVTDPGQSGASLERPGMDRIRDLVAAGGVSVVLAQDRDRLAREPAYHYLLKREFEEHGCKIRALNDRGDESPEGELTDGILDQLAKYERAKVAERTRRGKRKKVQEGKILATHTADYGFRFNAARDGYEVDEERMAVVRDIFRWIGIEGWSIRRVRKTLDDLGIELPGGYMNKSRRWNETQLRRIVANDAYRPHSFEEVEPLVAPEVAATLDPEKSYGIWWWGRERHRMRQVSERGPGGKVYKKVTRSVPVPKEEWVAVPVPDAGVPVEWVEAAREALKKNERPSFNSERFWELSGGIVRCGCCGWAMGTTTVSSTGLYYRCRRRIMYGRDVCDMKKHLRADLIEPLVWEGVSEVLGEPERLRRGLQRMIEKEKEASAVDHEGEAHIWQERLSEIGRKRANFQDLAAEGLMTRRSCARSWITWSWPARRPNANSGSPASVRRGSRPSSGTPKTSWRPTGRGASRPWKTSRPKIGERCTGYLTSRLRPTRTGGSRPAGP